MLDDVIGGYQAYIQRKKDLFIYLWRLEFRSWLRPRAVSRLRAFRARRDYKVATLSALRAEFRSESNKRKEEKSKQYTLLQLI